MDDECVCDYEECIIYIEDCPTADVQEVKHGRWEDNYVGDSIEGLYCTECGEICGCEFDYCPNCGAKMDEEVQTDET